MAQDMVDSVFNIQENHLLKKQQQQQQQHQQLAPANDSLYNKVLLKEKRKNTLRYIFNRIRLKRYGSVTISRPDSTYRVAYLGNVVTGWAKGEGCLEKPLTTLWRNYTQSSRPDVSMQLTITGGGLKVVTKSHGLTEYWAHRLTTCAAPTEFPRIFCWIYRHEGKRLRHELRCHAVLCSSNEQAKKIEKELKDSLALALIEFKKDKLSKQNARLSLVNSVYENPSIPRRKILLNTGSQNYRPPLERSKSAPKLSSIEEILEEEDIYQSLRQIYNQIMKYYDNCNLFVEQRAKFLANKLKQSLPKERTIRQTSINFNNNNNSMNNNGVIFVEKKNEIQLVENSSIIEVFNTDNLYFKECDNESDGISRNNSISSSSNNSELEFSDINTCNNTNSSLTLQINGNSGTLEKCPNDKRTELDFKIGGTVLPAVKSLEKLQTIDLKTVDPLINKGLVVHDNEVSLIPVGEIETDFSSLKVYKRKNVIDGNKDILMYNIFQTTDRVGDINQNEDENNRNSNNELNHLGEEDISSRIENIVMV